MTIDFEDIFAEATRTLLHGSTTTLNPTKTPGPIPTVVPDVPEWQRATKPGYTTFWIAFVIMLLSSAAFAAMSWRIPVSKRIFHIITTLVTLIAALAYFGMALGQGKTWHKAHAIDEHHHGIPDVHRPVFRELYFARFVNWFLTTPLLLAALALLAGLSGAHLTMALLADVVMVAAALFASFGHDASGQKWGWYAVACIAFLVVVWHLALNGRVAARARGGKVGGAYAALAGYTVVVWALYPVIWGLSDGSRRLSVDGEIIAYAVLDVLAGPVFGFWLLATLRRVPEASVEASGWWTNGLSGEGRIRLGEDAS